MTYADYRTKITELNLEYRAAIELGVKDDIERLSDTIDELIKEFYEN